MAGAGRRKKTEAEKTISEIVDEAVEKSMRHMTGKDGRLNTTGQKMAAVLKQIDETEKMQPDEPGKYHTFYEIVNAYRLQVEKFKACGCDIRQINPLAQEVKDKISTWDWRCHPEFMQFFFYQYCEGCRDAMIERVKSPEAKALLSARWKKILSPRVYPPWQRPFGAPMPHWPRRSRRSLSR